MSLPLMAIGAWQYVTSGSIAIVAPTSAAAIIAVMLMGWIFWRNTAAAWYPLSLIDQSRIAGKTRFADQ